jgi:predicted ATP-grasp superfamily ATP-dependent carboligase
VLCASRYVDEFVAFPGDETDEGVWRRLLELGKRHPGGLVFPLDDRATRMLLERRERFPEWLRLPPLPALEIHARATSKAGFAGILGEAGLAHPATLRGSREALLAGVRAGFPFPVLLKPVGRLGGQGIRRFDEAAALVAEMETDGFDREGYVVQEYIEGTDLGGAFLADRGRLVAATTQRVLKRGSGYAPPTEVYVEPLEEFRRLLERLARHLNWSGVAQVDAVVDRRDGGIRLLELNGRFWGSLLASTAAGVNFPLLWLDLVEGRCPSQPAYGPLKFFTGGLGIRRVLGLRGPRLRPSETDLRYVLRDPMPAVRAASIKYLGVSGA